MKPKRFSIENWQQLYQGGFMVRLVIEDKYIPFIEALPFVSSVEDFTTIGRGQYHIWLDPRYDTDEAWLALYEALDNETKNVELSDIWDVE